MAESSLHIAPAPAVEEPLPELRRGVLRVLLADWSACLGLAVLAGFVVLAALAPVIAPHDPLLISPDRLTGPSWQHLLGTDMLGRDIFSRLLFGARLSLGSAAVAAVLVMTIGVVVGTVAGYRGGLVDSVLMRLVDLILAVPGLVLAFAIAGLFQPSLWAVLLGLVTVWWVGYARIVRSLVLSVRERQHVEAARALGAGGLGIIVRHILPNVVPSIIVLLTLRMGGLILAISGLNFLGLGAQPPTPEWGAMLNEARPYFPSSAHLMLAPGLAISLVVLSLNLLGDGLRDVLDPRLRGVGRGA
jgi:peptide/nickel transport system permease protein